MFLAQLGDLNEPELLEQVVLAAMGIRDRSGNPLLTLSGYLMDKHSLLVLDNCEHLCDACSQLAGELLRACARLRVLTTSREALRIAGEHVFVVPPLSTPDPNEPRRPALDSSRPRTSFWNEPQQYTRTSP